MELKIQYQNHIKKLQFFVTNLGINNMILGYPFLTIANPKLDWKKGTMKGTVVMSTHDAHKWKVLSQIWKTTTLMQLAIKEAEKRPQQTWDQIVPKQYHHFKKVLVKKNQSDSLSQSIGTML